MCLLMDTSGMIYCTVVMLFPSWDSSFDSFDTMFMFKSRYAK